MQPLEVSVRSAEIRYAVRDVVLVAREAAAAGREMLYLNIGDPNQFDFATPPHVMDAVCKAVRDNQTSYTASEGLPSALEAIRADATERSGISSVRDAFVGNGASECIEIALTSLLNPGQDVLTPSPGYPLYTAVLSKLGAPENPYFLDEDNGWQPDVEDIARKITPNTRAIVLINPNNPTGSVCSESVLRGILELADKHGLVIFADEIYDRLVLDQDKRHVSIASLSDSVPILTFNGLSKAYLAPGLRLGWCVSSGPEARLRPYIEAMHKFLRARLCANHAVQHAVVPALTGDQSHLVSTIETLRRRRQIVVEQLSAVPGVTFTPPDAAFYGFPRLLNVDDDEAWVKGLVRETGVVVVHGSGFGQKPGTSHFRVVFLPQDEKLKAACTRIGEFAASQ